MRLLLHREASSVLADAFELYANAYERTILMKDFYGKEAALVTVTLGSDEEKEKSKKGLKGLIEGADKERIKRVLNSVKDNLTNMYVSLLYLQYCTLNLFQLQQPGQGCYLARNRPPGTMGVPHGGERVGGCGRT